MITVKELQAILGDAEARGHGDLPVVVVICKDATTKPQDLAYGNFTDSEGDEIFAIDGMRGLFPEAERRNVELALM